MSKFANLLIYWYKDHKRNLPWRHTRDPYLVWLSEIILQQTQVKQGLPYYEAFVKHFPNVFALAAASEEEVLKLWQGLGYYSRARNLHQAAKIVVEKYNGVFPDTYKGLKTLKGVGDYTASAVASFCYDEPVAVLDGNVFRVLSRFLGIDTPINTTEGKKLFKQQADKLLDKTHVATYNQAIMEFGALQCKPKKPNCEICPLQDACVAFRQERVDSLPVKLKKTKIKNRYFNYIVYLAEEGLTVLQKRTGQGIWRNLYEFPLIETDKLESVSEFRENLIKTHLIQSQKEVTVYNEQPIKHVLSHQHLYVRFWIVETNRLGVTDLNKGQELVLWQNVEKFPVPAIIDKFLNEFAVTA